MSLTETVRPLVVEAGHMAARMRATATVDRKADASFVTSADLAVQEFLMREIGRRFPGDGFVAEEQGVGRGAQAAGRLWVLDPIDGTASYATGLPGWGVSVGLVEDGRAVAGWFHMPETGDLFVAGPEAGMTRNGRAAAVRPPEPFARETAIFIDSGFHKRFLLDPTFPGKVRSLGTTVGHLAYVAAGCADAAVLHDVHVWDFASALAMLECAGGVMQYLDGTPVAVGDYLAGEDALRPMVAGHPETVARLAELIASRE
jgi:fructose-1,6-bisphosphatase/inositol monophosphatase family enzyme